MAGLGKIVGSFIGKNAVAIEKAAVKTEKAAISPELALFQERFGDKLLGVRNGIGVVNATNIPFGGEYKMFYKLGENGKMQLLKQKSFDTFVDGNFKTRNKTDIFYSPDMQSLKQVFTQKGYRNGRLLQKNITTTKLRHKRPDEYGLAQYREIFGDMSRSKYNYETGQYSKILNDLSNLGKRNFAEFGTITPQGIKIYNRQCNIPNLNIHLNRNINS